MPGNTKVSLHDNGPGRRWNETFASVLTLSWDPDLLSGDPQATVDINFVGYIENIRTFQVQVQFNSIDLESRISADVLRHVLIYFRCI